MTNMKSRFIKIITIVLACVFFVAVAGCGKENGENSSITGSSSKPGVQTAGVKTTSKPVSASMSQSSAASGIATYADTTEVVVTTGANSETSEISESTEEIEANQDSGTGNNTGDVTVSPDEKVYDLKGREIKFCIATLTENPQNPFPSDTNKVYDTRYKLMKAAEEKFNCKFVFELLPGGIGAIHNLFQTSYMAGTLTYDAYRITRSKALMLYDKNGWILPLNEYIDISSDVVQRYKNYHAYGLFNTANLYAIWGCNVQIPYIIWYHTDMMNREGISLKEYLYTNTWNWNTFLDVAQKMTQDTNGDGVIDIWGLTTDSSQTIGRAFLYSNLATVVSREGEKYVYSLDDYKAMKPLQFLSDFYHTYKVITYKNGTTDFEKNLASMYIAGDWWLAVNKSKYPQSDITFIQLPNGPDNPGNASVLAYSALHEFFFPATLTDPEPVVKALTYWQILWDESKPYYCSDEEVFVSAARVRVYEDDIDRFINLFLSYTNIKDEYVDYFPPAITKVVTDVIYKVATQITATSSAIDACKPAVQDIIDAATAK
ncbi:MAG: extracellular solute-binding protein [Eubacteriales bacterium]|nr:extracellular solute-binding protein [Eubacteriales bacterium]